MINLGTDTVILLVNGQSYSGWKKISITQSIEAIASGFDLQVTDKWGILGTVRPIKEGDACQLKSGRDLILSGYIDEVSPVYTKDDHSISISGRSRAGDLVDCTIEGGKWEFQNHSLEAIVACIARPFGLTVSKKCDTGEPFDSKFAFEPGEKAFEAIDRACKMRGVLPISDAAGNILLVQTGDTYADTDLVFGKNIESVRGRFSAKDRYSCYTVKGQRTGTNDFFGKEAAHIKGSATDPNVTRYRPLTIIAEGQVDSRKATVRAEWEASVRAGRSGTVAVVVTGWRQNSGELWKTNTLVEVYIPPLQLEYDPLLITDLTFSLSESGSETEITLRKPAAYKPAYWKTKKDKKDEWTDVRKATGSKL
jgi:prophage tail gpP-like protein